MIKVSKQEFQKFIFQYRLEHCGFSSPMPEHGFTDTKEHYGNYDGDSAEYVKNADGTEEFYILKKTHQREQGE